MAQWHYTKNGQQFGPVTDEHLQDMARGGQLGRDDLIWRDGMANWAPAGSIPEIFGSKRPRRERGYRDDDCERPIRRRKKKSSTGLIIGLLVGGCVVVVLVCGGVIAVAIFLGNQMGDQIANGPLPPPPVGIARFDLNTTGFLPRRLQKTHTVFMKANTRYTINAMSNSFDCFIELRDPTGRMVDSDDDGGLNLNSRLHYTARQSGNFRIVIRDFGNFDSGKYRLTVHH